MSDRLNRELLKILAGGDARVERALEALLRKSLTETPAQIDAVEGDVSALRNDTDNLQTSMTAAQSDITTLQGDVTDANADIAALDSRVTTLESVTGFTGTFMSMTAQTVTVVNGIITDVS